VTDIMIIRVRSD